MYSSLYFTNKPQLVPLNSAQNRKPTYLEDVVRMGHPHVFQPWSEWKAIWKGNNQPQVLGTKTANSPLKRPFFWEPILQVGPLNSSLNLHALEVLYGK